MAPHERALIVQDLLVAIKADEAMHIGVEEREWIRLGVERERERSKRWNAVIEKTLAGLVWMLVLAAGSILLEGVKAWFKR
jgi:hypothetical protein